MTDDTIREFEAPGVEDIERFTTLRALLLEKFNVPEEHATRLAFEIPERHPTLTAAELTSTHVEQFLRELAHDKGLEAQFRKSLKRS